MVDVLKELNRMAQDDILVELNRMDQGGDGEQHWELGKEDSLSRMRMEQLQTSPTEPTTARKVGVSKDCSMVQDEVKEQGEITANRRPRVQSNIIRKLRDM